MRSYYNKHMDMDFLAEAHPDVMLVDGYDDCIIGIVNRIGTSSVLLYDTEKIIAKLVKDGLTDEEAYEFFEFNILGAYVGEHTPAFLEIPMF